MNIQCKEIEKNELTAMERYYLNCLKNVVTDEFLKPEKEKDLPEREIDKEYSYVCI